MKVTLRSWCPEDAKALSDLLNNKNILKNLRDGIPYPYTEADAADYITSMLSADKNNTFAYAVCADGRVVGSIGAFRNQNVHFRTAELGYYLNEKYWGKGVMTESVKLLCCKLFSETDLLRIYAEPFACNIGSRRVLEKAGFAYEGTMRKGAIKDGEVIDMVLYAMIRDDKTNEDDGVSKRNL